MPTLCSPRLRAKKKKKAVVCNGYRIRSSWPLLLLCRGEFLFMSWFSSSGARQEYMLPSSNKPGWAPLDYSTWCWFERCPRVFRVRKTRHSRPLEWKPVACVQSRIISWITVFRRMTACFLRAQLGVTKQKLLFANSPSDNTCRRQKDILVPKHHSTTCPTEAIFISLWLPEYW